MDLHHLPAGTHSLAPRPGSLVRWTFHEEVLAFGATELVVEPLAADHLTGTYRARFRFRPNWSAWQDLHLQPFRFERNASTLGYTRSG